MTIAEFFQFLVGFPLLLLGADLLVRGASHLAKQIGISPLIVGLTVVAYGTSAPELAVSIGAALNDKPELAVGNVIGSNISNVLLVLGISAVISPLIVSRYLVRSSVPLMIFVSGIFWLVCLDGIIDQLEGGALFGGAVGYTLYAILKSRRETKQLKAAGTLPQKVDEKVGGIVRTLIDVALIGVGLVMLVFGANFLVSGAVAIATWMEIDRLVIGLTIVAVGTSLPEIATSIMAAWKGEKDIAVGNVVGSNIFNVLLVIGGTAVVAKAGIAVEASAISFDLPIMFVVSLACLPIFFTGYTIDRWEGALFLGFYVAYTVYLFTMSSEMPHVVWYFLAPLLLMTVVVFVLQGLGAKRRREERLREDAQPDQTTPDQKTLTAGETLVKRDDKLE